MDTKKYPLSGDTIRHAPAALRDGCLRLETARAVKALFEFYLHL